MNIRLKVAIVEKGLKQRQLARACQMRETRLSNIIHGWAWAMANERAKIARELGRTVDELFG